MGGELRIRSQIGHGTCFYFTLKSSYVDPVEAEKEIREQALIFDDDDEPEHKEIEVGVGSTSTTSTDSMTVTPNAPSTFASFAGVAHAGMHPNDGAPSLMAGSSSSSPLTGIVIEMTSPVTTTLAPASQSSPGRELISGVQASSHASAMSGTSMSAMTSDVTSPHGAVVSITSSQQMALIAAMATTATAGISSPQSQIGVATSIGPSSVTPPLSIRTLPLLPTLTIPPETMVTSNGQVVVVPPRTITPTRLPVFHADPTIDDSTGPARQSSSPALVSSPQWNQGSPTSPPPTNGDPSVPSNTNTGGGAGLGLGIGTGHGHGPSGSNGGSTNSSPSTGTRRIGSVPPSPAASGPQQTTSAGHTRSGSGNTPQSNGPNGRYNNEDSRSTSRSGSHSVDAIDVQLPLVPPLAPLHPPVPRHLVPMHYPINVSSGMVGSTRSDDLPIVGTHAGSTPSFSSLSTGTGGGLRILVAEDNQINQRVLVRLLARGRHRVVLCTNGKQAADAFLARPAAFDCIIMDIHMPVLIDIFIGPTFDETHSNYSFRALCTVLSV
jgi:CheY-like chemotaxis protein